MVRCFTQLYPVGSNLLIQRNPGCLAVVKGRLIPYFKQTRNFSDDGKDKGPAKEEEDRTAKMPGFVHPENIKEEGYFTQKAKKQLEELKRKADKSPVEHPERKI